MEDKGLSFKYKDINSYVHEFPSHFTNIPSEISNQVILEKKKIIYLKIHLKVLKFQIDILFNFK